jgi:hypothetical protein
MPLRKKKKKKNERIELLEQFQAKAGCIHTQSKTISLWMKLGPHLEGYFDGKISYGHWLNVAWSHFEIGEGREELDYYCNKLKKLWSDEDDARNK